MGLLHEEDGPVAMSERILLLPAGGGKHLPVAFLTARGCSMNEWRAQNLRQSAECESPNAPQGYGNTYLTLKEDKRNKYDPDAIELLAKGEFFGNAGFVGKEQTKTVRALAELCGVRVKDLGVAVADKSALGEREVPIIAYGAPLEFFGPEESCDEQEDGAESAAESAAAEPSKPLGDEAGAAVPRSTTDGPLSGAGRD